ncbi:MAG: hypothetical protein IPM54_06040 [Polyangiaceae bacterium]|nr:hypothetical protein [Polyangiaceae bacterium]
MTRSSLLLVFGLLLAACGGGSAASTAPATPTGLNDADALKKLDAELAKPMPDLWKESSVAFITDPVAMCDKPDVDAQAKTEASSQLEKAKSALQDAGVTVQESVDNASVVFSIRILANCSGSGSPLVTGDVSAMPGNGAVAAKSDLFEVSRFDAGKVTLALLRNDDLVKKMSAK